MMHRPRAANEGALWWRLPRQLRFLVAGAYNTAFGYLAFATLFLALGKRVHYMAIALLCLPVCLASAFIVHRKLVFRSREPWLPSFVRFNISQLAAMLFGIAALYVLVRFAGLGPLTAQAVVVAASTLLTYLLHRRFSFARSDDTGGEAVGRTGPQGGAERSGGTP